MVPEIAEFNKWLRRKSPYATTPIHYSNDLKLFFAWLEKAPDQVRVSDIDAYIERCQSQGQAMATINRRLAAIRSFYHFLGLLSDEAPANPVVPKRHFIRQGRRLSISASRNG
jgi:site-specific recombinase XerD